MPNSRNATKASNSEPTLKTSAKSGTKLAKSTLKTDTTSAGKATSKTAMGSSNTVTKSSASSSEPSKSAKATSSAIQISTPAIPDSNAMLTMMELAAYLHIDDRVISRLAASGKLPGIQIDNSWRFRRADVDTWISEQILGESENFTDAPDGMKVPLDDLVPESAIIPVLKSRDAIGVVEELAARAYSNNWLTDKPWFVGAVVEREALASTAMEGGVAFLHTRAKDKGKITRPFIVVGRSWEGVQFGAPDGRPTYLFFLLGLRYDKLHLPILGRLARALRVPATIARLRSLSSPGQIRALLLREDEALRSGHIPDVPSEPVAPILDRTMRLRSIRRLDQMRKREDEKEEKAKAKAKTKSRAKAKPKA